MKPPSQRVHTSKIQFDMSHFYAEPIKWILVSTLFIFFKACWSKPLKRTFVHKKNDSCFLKQIKNI